MAIQFKGVKAKMFMLVYKFVEVHDGLYCGHKGENLIFCFEDAQRKQDFHDTLVSLNLMNVNFRSLDSRQMIVTI